MYPYMAQWIRLVECAGGAAVVGNSVDRMLRLEVNESGFNILRLCNGRHTEQDIIDSIACTCAMDDNDMRSITDFIKQYIEMDILHVSEAPVEREPRIVGSKDIILPVSVGMEITSRCQLKCIHCFNSSGQPGERELSTDELIGLVDQFVEFGAINFFITGGEPMLKPGIERLIERLGSQRLTVSLISNGVYLPEAALRALARNKNISVRISIDGMHDIHDAIRGVPGTFARAQENIERMLRSGIAVSISFTLNDINREELGKVACHFKELGCEGIAVGVTSSAGRAKENKVPHGSNRDYYILLDSVREKYDSASFAVGIDICEEKVKHVLEAIPYPNKCGAGYSSIAVRPDGTITPCTTMPKWPIGSVYELHDALNVDNLQPWRNLPTPTPDECGECDQTMFCAYCLANMLESDAHCRIKERDPHAFG